MEKPYVLLVCTGNTCRSSMAEHILREMFEKTPALNGVQVGSAGIMALEGDKAHPTAVKVLGEWGLDLSRHRARSLTPEMVYGAALVLTMSEQHRQTVLELAPGTEEKVHTLKGFATGKPGDIPDPWNSGEETYRACAREIRDLLGKSLDKIQEFIVEDKGRKRTE